MQKGRVPAAIVWGSIAACGLLFPGASWAQKNSAPQSPAPDEMQKRMMRIMTPGAAHQRLAKLSGNYVTKTQFTMPGTAPVETAGTASLSMVLDGRFLREDDTGVMSGMPFKGMRFTGYNNASGKYEGSWFWTSSTGILNLTGTSADSGKSIDWTGTYDDETGAPATLHIVQHQLDANRFVMRIEGREGGPTVETTYTRKK